LKTVLLHVNVGTNGFFWKVIYFQRVLCLFSLFDMSEQQKLNTVSYLHKICSRPSVNFTNVLLEAFTSANPDSAKKDCQLDCILCAFRICARKKAACRTLLKLTPKECVKAKHAIQLDCCKGVWNWTIVTPSLIIQNYNDPLGQACTTYGRSFW